MYQCKKYSQFYSALKSLDENSKPLLITKWGID